MKDGGRLSAAIEVLNEVETRHRPVQQALKDWGTAHRFAGSGDRTVIGNLVFDALRQRESLAWRVQSHTARMLILATYTFAWNNGLERLEEVLGQDHHAPDPLTDEERGHLEAAPETPMDDAAAANIPAWLWPGFVSQFGEHAVAEGEALATRAPIDLRTNVLKSSQEKLLKRLGHVHAQACKHSPAGMRISPKPGAARMPHVQAEEGYRKGWFELQDEASQLAALLAGAKPGMQVLDYCAGGGGKTLALAAAMENKGQIYAYDADRLRLAPIHERLQRASARNVQVRDPKSSKLDALTGEMDLVFIDAPCTGTGVWRRRPDSKWKLSERAVEDRVSDQRQVLQSAAAFVKPGGRLAYVTCSLLLQENAQQVTWFLENNSDFQAKSALENWRALLPDAAEPRYANERGDITLTPASTGTDGFYIALLQRQA